MTGTPAEGVDPRQELADGHRIPALGLGVWQVRNGAQCVNAVRWALELGYRHIDTAQAYGNEESVGVGVRQSGVARDQVTRGQPPLGRRTAAGGWP
jgi:2,5-diketo-D-gluconate reductase A